MANLKLNISFNTTPSFANAVVAQQKYNKTTAVMQTWDDGNEAGWDNGRAIWAANNHGCTDGCGNFKLMTGDIAVNVNNVGTAKNTFVRKIINAGGDIINHSLEHGTTGGNLYQAKTLDDLVTLENDYKMNNFAIPNSDSGFGQACVTLGYAAITSAGDVFDILNPTRFYRIFDINTSVNPTWAINREFGDEWQTTAQKDLFKSEIDKMLTGQRNYYMIGTHDTISDSAKAAGFKEIYDYIKTKLGDTVLMCSWREWTEYFLMRKAVITQQLAGNILTVTVNTDSLSDRIRWQDLSFNISSDKTIVGVTFEGFTSTSFNSTTGLVNGFKQKTSWSGVVDPPTNKIFYTAKKFI